jgi:hypothetical protein
MGDPISALIWAWQNAATLALLFKALISVSGGVIAWIIFLFLFKALGLGEYSTYVGFLVGLAVFAVCWFYFIPVMVLSGGMILVYLAIGAPITAVLSFLFMLWMRK